MLISIHITPSLENRAPVSQAQKQLQECCVDKGQRPPHGRTPSRQIGLPRYGPAGGRKMRETRPYRIIVASQLYLRF